MYEEQQGELERLQQEKEGVQRRLEEQDALLAELRQCRPNGTRLGSRLKTPGFEQHASRVSLKVCGKAMPSCWPMLGHPRRSRRQKAGASPTSRKASRGVSDYASLPHPFHVH
ncbi:hypothetical protein TN45_31120 (plasmid) [Pseudomonas aeruginosa]|nr:hypothetical protein TN45_31120 [Pseudomonas aeruginosa]